MNLIPQLSLKAKKKPIHEPFGPYNTAVFKKVWKSFSSSLIHLLIHRKHPVWDHGLVM